MKIEKIITLDTTDRDALLRTAHILNEINHYGCFSIDDIKNIANGKCDNIKLDFNNKGVE